MSRTLSPPLLALVLSPSKNAVMLAAVFEFTGAMFMGGHVVKTIRKGIANQKCFDGSFSTDPANPAQSTIGDPGLLMYGCLCVIFAVSIWLVVASALEMPVSTTHSCVGGMIGMTMVARGSECVIWTKKSDDFPYVKGVVAVIISWLLSLLFPVVSPSASSSLCVRWSCARSTLTIAPPSLSLSCSVARSCINIFFIVYKGAKFLELDNTPVWKACAIGFGVGGGAGILSYFLVVPYIKRTTDELYDKMQLEKAETGSERKVEETVVRQPREYPTGVFGAPMRMYYAIQDHLDASLAHKASDILEEDMAVNADSRMLKSLMKRPNSACATCKFSPRAATLSRTVPTTSPTPSVRSPPSLSFSSLVRCQKS